MRNHKEAIIIVIALLLSAACIHISSINLNIN
jgi:hypothetical protein